MYPVQTHCFVLSNKDKKQVKSEAVPPQVKVEKKDDKKPVFKPDPKVRY